MGPIDPGNILPFAGEGMEFPVRVSPLNRRRIVIDREPLVARYPKWADSAD